jgi:hypothetical protein
LRSQHKDTAHEHLAILKRGQILGFVALVLTLATIATLAAVGQPWVAGIVATGGLAGLVAIFVPGQYQPAPVHVAEVAAPQPVQLPPQELSGAPLLIAADHLSWTGSPVVECGCAGQPLDELGSVQRLLLVFGR